MSAVLSFFEQSPLSQDRLHLELKRIPEIKSKIRAIQHELLGCCGAEEKSGAVKLFVVDSERWEELCAERDGLMDRLRRLDELVDGLDAVFADAERAGFSIHRKTPEGLIAAEVHDRGVRRDPSAKPGTPTPANPRLAALVERANRLWSEARLS